LENLFDTRADDPHQMRLRHMVRHVPLSLIDERHGNNLALVRRGRQSGAVERLEPFRRGDMRRQPPRDVHGDMVAADRNGVGMDEMAGEEGAEARRAAAEIDYKAT